VVPWLELAVVGEVASAAMAHSVDFLLGDWTESAHAGGERRGAHGAAAQRRHMSAAAVHEVAAPGASERWQGTPRKDVRWGLERGTGSRVMVCLPSRRM
jgi:hypothetical protein